MLVSELQGAIDRRALVSASPDQFRSLSDMSPLRTPKHRHTAAPASGRAHRVAVNARLSHETAPRIVSPWVSAAQGRAAERRVRTRRLAERHKPVAVVSEGRRGHAACGARAPKQLGAAGLT